MLKICRFKLKWILSLNVSQRDVRSDPEAVRQVARATNNLLDSLGSLAVEVRNTPYPLTLQ